MATPALVLRRKRRRQDDPIAAIHLKVARVDDSEEKRPHLDVHFELAATDDKVGTKRKGDDDDSKNEVDKVNDTKLGSGKRRKLVRTSLVTGLRLAAVNESVDEKEGNANVYEVVDDQEISCNGVQAVRETLSKEGSGEGDQDDEEFVYDVYKLSEEADLDFDDAFLDRVMSVHGVCMDDLVHDLDDDEYTKYEKQMMGEDSDSNDEDNWRNDYPDEEEYNYNAYDSQDEREDTWERMNHLRLSDKSSDDENEF